MSAQPDGNAGFLPHTANLPLPSSITNVPGPGESTWQIVADAGCRDPRRTTSGPHIARTLTVYPRVFGEYQLLDELGSGGMGIVYKARQEGLNRTVALKMVRSGFLATDREIQRFQNEAEAIALLDHPNIVPIYQVGQCEGQRYFSMKLISDGSLSLQLEIARLGNERARTNSQLKQRTHSIQKLRNQLSEVTVESTKVNELETELARSVAEMEQIQQANGKIVGQLESRASEVVRLREKLASAESEKRRIRQQLDSQVRRSRSQPAPKTSAKPKPPKDDPNASPTKNR